MAPSLMILFTTFLTVSSTLAAPHAHRVLHHHRKHPFGGVNATAFGATGTGTGYTVLPSNDGSSGSSTTLTVTVSPVVEGDGSGAGGAPVPTQAPAAPAAGGSGSATTPEKLVDGSGECGTEETTITVTSTETDIVTVTMGGGSPAGPGGVGGVPSKPTTAPYGMGNFSVPAATGSAAVPVGSSSSTSSVEGGGFFELPSETPSSSSSSTTSPSDPSDLPGSTVTSSSTSTPTSPPTGGGMGKRGLAYNAASLTNAFSKSSNFGFTYNWASDPSGTVPFTFAPMLWGLQSDFTDTWSDAASSAIASGSKVLLGLNEPDHPDQAAVDPVTAAAGHQKHMNPFSGQAEISSPAVTNGGGSMGLNWLESFFEACGGKCQVDILAVHWYDSAENVDYFKSHITDAINLAKKNNVPKVWITEFQGQGTLEQQAAFLEEVMPWLDSQDEIGGYAWFMCADQNLIDGEALSTLGEIYAK